ncbi:hypothetical protein FRFR103141_05040 [Fructilactobacillus fructivorans]|uniref:hypothetical protein n=1 Tax=Fructilactobacillus fructivorans TaxID=1614 RepID=UPI00070D377B|nr:hypothetical protein [Fructilactobacillus fructivorans]
MRLNEFYVSSEDLSNSYKIYVEINKDIFPIFDIEFSDQKILLVPNKYKHPLTLSQFNIRTSQLDDHLSLFCKTNEIPKLFGYRLKNDQLIFG